LPVVAPKAAAGWPPSCCVRPNGVSRRIGKLATLRRARDFDEAFRHGKRYRGKSLLLICARRPEGGLRAAFLTAKTVGSAVRRNRQRRRLREACRALWSRIAAQPADVIFMALPSAAQCPYASLRREMEVLLGQAGVLVRGDPT